METKTMHMAPMQGYTEAEYRRAWREVYGQDMVQYTPFVRVEHGEVSPRWLRDALSPLNAGEVPQVIASGVEEFKRVTEPLRQAGVRRIDLNMGCPHPPQVKKGRGCGLIGRTEALEQVARAMQDDAECVYSVKMRAGVDAHDEWHRAVEVLNDVPLAHVTMHARVARDLYRGTAREEVFREFAEACSHPVVYNGDIATVADIERALSVAQGVMLGRGLLAQPWLVSEWREGEAWDESRRLDSLRRLHARYRQLLEERITGGDHQLLSKLKPFWDYAEGTVGRKVWKALHKATTMRAYNEAVNSI